MDAYDDYYDDDYYDDDYYDDYYDGDYNNNNIIELKGPPGYSRSLWEANLDPRRVTQFQYPSKEYSPEIEWVGDAIKCPNGLLLYPDWVISGYHALSFEEQSEKLSECYYWYSRISRQTVRVYNGVMEKIRKLEGGISGMTISELYAIIGDCRACSIFETSLARQLAEMTRTENVQRVLDKLKAKDEETGNPRKFAEVVSEVMKFDSHWYLDLAATHMFVVCSGKCPRYCVGEEDRKRLGIYELPPSPTAIALFGQELWFVMNLVHPRLNALYNEAIVPVVRKKEPWAQSYMFECGESFAVDFWQAWSEALRVYQAKFTHWFRMKYCPDGDNPDLESMRGEMKSICKIADDEPVTRAHLDKFRSGMYFMAGLMEDNPIRYDQHIFVRVAFQIKAGEDGIIETF